MPIFTNFYNSPNRVNRPANKDVINSLTPQRSIQVVGCDITNTSTYIDFNVDLTDYHITILELSKWVYSLSYLKVENSDNTVYFIFVDKVEPNNFNDNLNIVSYRIYFTIDWWSTLLNQFDTSEFNEYVIDSIEGDVVRAHVDDVDSNGTPTLVNTTYEPEEDIGEMAVYGARMQNDNFNELSNSDVKWRYILLDLKTIRSGEIVSTFYGGNSSTTRYASTCPCGVCVMPEIGGKTVEFYIEMRDEDGNLVSTKTYPSGMTLANITDPRVVHSFVTSIPPVFCSYVNPTDREPYIFAYRYKNGDNLSEKDVGYSTIEWQVPGELGNIQLPMFKCVEGFTSVGYSALFNSNSNLSLIPSTDRPIYTYTRPTTYASYHNSCIVKARSEAYINCVLACNYETFVLPQTRTDLSFKTMIDYEKGGVILLTTDKMNKSDYNNRVQLGQDRTFELIKVVDRLKVLQGILTGGLAGGEAITRSATLANKFGKASARAIGGYLAIAATAIETVSSSMATARGVSTSQPTSISQDCYDNLPTFMIFVPSNLDTIKNRLMKYGYNTTADFQTVWKQKRKYYNYIKTFGCNVTFHKFCTEAKLQIEEMFNNGVWLWNSVNAPSQDCKDLTSRVNAMGYLYLNNYPIILDT